MENPDSMQVLPLMSYVALGKLVDLTIPQFSNLWNGEKNTTYIIGLFWEFIPILSKIVQFDILVRFNKFQYIL